MNKDKKNKILSIVLYVVSTVIIIGLLVGLIDLVYSFNNNYREYEFKFTSNAVTVVLGQDVVVPIVSIDDKNVNFDDYTYTSSDNSIISVSEDGNITGNKVGTAVVVVKAKKSNQKKLLNVNVVLKGNAISIQDINLSLSDLNLKVGQTHYVSYEVVPSGALADNIIWSSSNTSVATVDKGVIIAKGAGKCTIYVNEGTINKQINVVVTN